MENIDNNLSGRSMNWTKLKSSSIVFFSILLMSCQAKATITFLFVPALSITNTTTHHLTLNQAISECDTSQIGKDQRSVNIILNLLLQHLQEQDPSFFNSYSSIDFHQFQVRTNTASKIEKSAKDTIKGIKNQTNDNIIFAFENLSSQKLLKPGNHQSENISAKTEGKDNGIYAKMASLLRDFSLFNPANNLFNKTYLSPFSTTTFHNYCFTASDTISAIGDSLLKISFQPQAGKSFNGFTGSAIIDAKRIIIQQIKAQSIQNNPQEPLIIINQKFEYLKGFWLPSEKRTTFFFNGKNINGEELPDIKQENLIAESTFNKYQQEINPPLHPEDFNNSLSQTQADSTVITEYQNRQDKMIRLMAEGKVQLGCFNLDYNKIFGYNLFEGIKIGFGGETNSLLSNHVTLGGYLSYGLKDKSLHHGEWIDIYPTHHADLKIHLGYRDMNLEFGNPEFLQTASLLNPENYRNLLIQNMFSTKRYTAGLEFRPFNELNLYLFGDMSENTARLSTQYLTSHPFNPISLTRAGLQLRYSPGIKHKMEDGRLIEVTPPNSDYYLTVIQGLSVLSGEARYTKIEFKGKFDLPIRTLGTTTILVRSGIMSPEAPIIELFNGYGSFTGTFSLAAPYSFGTMRLNEFSAANYAAIHIRHNFSTWLFPTTMQKQPAFIFAQNIGFGKLNDQNMAQLNLNDYRKGFYESGFEINNLLRMNYLSWGVGIYYRYGSYRFSSIHENFAYKFGFLFKL
jgi:hypothetical protein